MPPADHGTPPQSSPSGPKANADSLRLSSLPRNAPRSFDLRPDDTARGQLARELGLDGLRKLRFHGTLTPLAGKDWALKAKLGATLVQPCIVTGAPVTTRVDVTVSRAYQKDFVMPSEAEAEMPEDDSVEALPETLDLETVMTEALALNVPDYPRAQGAELGSLTATPPGAEPLRDEDTKPFAGLSALKAKLDEPGGESSQ